MPQLVKFVVFVPKAHLKKVRTAICAAGAGQIGKSYDCCTFSVEGIGTFRPLKGAKPFIGKLGKLEKVYETRLETVVAKRDLKKVIAAMLKAHPYEVPAYDVYPLTHPADL